MREPTEAAILADWASQPQPVYIVRPAQERSYARICIIAALCCDAAAVLLAAIVSL
jgi:hypothetical protein